jgi:hypothetical protein
MTESFLLIIESVPDASHALPLVPLGYRGSTRMALYIYTICALTLWQSANNRFAVIFVLLERFIGLAKRLVRFSYATCNYFLFNDRTSRLGTFCQSLLTLNMGNQNELVMNIVMLIE